jgi:phage gp36-like protein
MRYLTLLQMAELPGALELAQVASDKHGKLVAPALMDASLRAGDRSAWSADEIAAADAAIARIEEAGGQADAIIDGYLGRRYTLPLPAVPSIVTTWARALTRYTLHGDRVAGEDKDPFVRYSRDALMFLALVGDGMFSLGLQDPQAAAESDVRIDGGAKAFGRNVWP